MQLYKEGSAVILQSKETFLNPSMAGLRDISVLILNAVGTEDKKLLDSTAATGIRGIRYALECGIKDLTLIDINPKAVSAIRSNLKRNRVKARLIGKSIQELSGSGAGPFDIIDLDPFGSPVPNVHDVLKMSHDGTMLMVTATDTAVLCGAHSDACIKMYNAKPLHNELCKESGIRILMGFIARSASQFNFGIEPILPVSNMHYMRVFVTLHRGAYDAAESMSQLGYVGSCGSCHAFVTSNGIVPDLRRECANCGNKMEFGGPLWLGKLYDKHIVSKALKHARSASSAKKDLERIYNEIDVPFLYSIPKLTKALAIGSVSSLRVIESLRNKSHQASVTQFEKDAVKTDAGIREVTRAVKAASAN